jgi:DNA-binding transcriptional ArsR family regulator
VSAAPLKLAKMRKGAEEAARLMRALGNEDRLLLLCQLSRGEQCVGDLEETTGILQPTLSQQLGVLRETGLVETRRDGRQIFYSLGDPGNAGGPEDPVRTLLREVILGRIFLVHQDLKQPRWHVSKSFPSKRSASATSRTRNRSPSKS